MSDSARLHELRRDGLCVLARTIQFSKNRPTGRPWDARIPRPKLDLPSGRPCLGEPSKVTRNYSPCQLFSSPDILKTFFRHATKSKFVSIFQVSGSCARFLKCLLEAKPEAEISRAERPHSIAYENGGVNLYAENYPSRMMWLSFCPLRSTNNRPSIARSRASLNCGSETRLLFT